MTRERNESGRLTCRDAFSLTRHVTRSTSSRNNSAGLDKFRRSGRKAASTSRRETLSRHLIKFGGERATRWPTIARPIGRIVFWRRRRFPRNSFRPPPRPPVYRPKQEILTEPPPSRDTTNLSHKRYKFRRDRNRWSATAVNYKRSKTNL